MSAFSRGCLRRHWVFKSPRMLNSFQSVNTPRFFNASALLRAARKPRPAQLQPNGPVTSTKFSPTKSNAQTVYTTYANSFAQKSHPTLLYEAPSHLLYMICAYTGALTCFGYSIYNCWTIVLHPNPELAQWIPLAFGGVVIMMSAGGTWLLMGASRIVRSMTALPRKSNHLVGALNRNVARTSGREVVSGTAEPDLQIEIVLKKMLPIPFFPARVIYTAPSQITLPQPLVPPAPKQYSAAELRQMRLEDEARLKQEHEYEQSHIMSSPIRHTSRAFFELFKAIGRTWTGDGFMKIVVNGQTYKLDVSSGWALDGGRALDRLAQIKPKLF